MSFELTFVSSVFFSPANFLHKCPHKKTHAREKKHTTTTHRKTLVLSLRNTINTPRTKTHGRKRKLEIPTPCAFFFSSLSSFQRESCIRIPLSEKREFEILNVRFCARERELTALSHHRHKKEANKCRTRKKRPRRKR